MSNEPIKTEKVAKKITVTKVIKRTKSTYSNADGVNKNSARLIMFAAINMFKFLTYNILSLPADNLIMENLLFNQISKRINFTFCEMNADIYLKLLASINTLPTLPFGVHNTKVGEIIKLATANQYTHLILDYCGQLGTFHKDIEDAITRNIIQVNGIIAVTVCKRFSMGDSMAFVEEMERLNKAKVVKVGENRTEPAANTFFLKVCGFNYAIETVFPYQDKDKTAMLLYIIRRLA